jgi:WXG100 family type VII secretion target
MSGFDLAHGALTDAAAAAAGAGERLRHDRRRIDAHVDGLLTGSWHGSAADSFRDCWDAWLVGANRVIDGLEAMSSLLVATGLDYARQDDYSQHHLGSVASRIVERLG